MVKRRFRGDSLPGAFYAFLENGPEVREVFLSVVFHNPTLASLRRGMKVFEDRIALMGVGTDMRI